MAEQSNLPNANDLLSNILAGLNFDTPTTTQQQAPPPGSSGELDSWLADWQSKSAATLGQQDADGAIFQDGGLDNLTKQLSPGELPKPPSMQKELERMRGEYDLDTLEKELNELKRLEREQQAIRRERIEGTFQERTRASAVQGQVSEIERQEMMRVDAINREIAYQVDQINTAYNAINTTMQVLQMDWQNAKEWWQTQFNANMAIYQQLRSEFEADRSFEEQKRQFEIDQAKSNLQVYAQMVTSGQLTYQNMDAATKAEITKLEIQSGLGKGFLSKVQMSPNDKIQSITTREQGGYQYSDIITYNPITGKMEKETIRLGAVDVPPSGGTTGDAAGDEYSIQERTQGARALLKEKVGGDGKVSPNTWNAVREQWVDAGLDGSLFDRTFAKYINLTHQNKFGGYVTEGNLSGEKGAFSRLF